MKWLRSQVREKIKYEQKVRKDLRDALTCNESDRKFLLQELARREEVLDELAAAKHGKPEEFHWSSLETFEPRLEKTCFGVFLTR